MYSLRHLSCRWLELWRHAIYIYVCADVRDECVFVDLSPTTGKLYHGKQGVKNIINRGALNLWWLCKWKSKGLLAWASFKDEVWTDTLCNILCKQVDGEIELHASYYRGLSPELSLHLVAIYFVTIQNLNFEVNVVCNLFVQYLLFQILFHE